MSTIFTYLKYLFEPLPYGKFEYFWILLGIAIALFVISIIVRILLMKKKEDKIFRKHFRKLPGTLQTLALFEGLYVLLRSLRLPYFSMRILHYIILLVTLYVVIKYVKTFVQAYPQAKKLREEQLEKNRYLPRKNT